MKTFYIDVYFLINFTTDILALYFAASLNKIKSTVLRLILAGCFGSAIACVIVLFDLSGALFVAVFLSGIVITVEIFCPLETKIRKFKMLFAFLLFETLIGGAVSFIYGLLDKSPATKGVHYIFHIISPLALLDQRTEESAHSLDTRLYLLGCGVRKIESQSIESATVCKERRTRHVGAL